MKFVAPLMPTLVETPRAGDDWIHEAKFDAYRWQLIIDENGTRIYTRNGRDWTSKYRELVEAAQTSALPTWQSWDLILVAGDRLVCGRDEVRVS